MTTSVPTAPKAPKPKTAKTAGHAFLNWQATALSPKVAKHVVIELVPYGKLDTNGYRFKIGKNKKAPSWHPSCYEPMLNLPTNYLNNSVEFDLFGVDKEAYECLTRWTQDAFNATLPPELSSFFAGEGSSNDLESDPGAGGVTTNKRKRSEEDDDEDVLALARYGCVVAIGPAEKRVHFEFGELATVTEPLDIEPPRYPATISAILDALEKKNRQVVGLAAMKMS
ncbi:hypothetical protein BDZ89DRAFT_1111752 [Hymenopellis radicata]|nr:hypothetical protein BDZ89DRAFT_1111752 [Hymenopellis radicata]